MNQVATREMSRGEALANEIEQAKVRYAQILPPHISPDKFKAVAVMAINHNPDLVHADRRSLLQALMKAAHDGLLPDGREGALVIFNTKVKYKDQNKAGGFVEKEKWVPLVQWMPMIAGLRIKARNSGEIVDWTAKVVHMKDHFELEEGLEPRIVHRPCIDGDPGEVRGAYSIARLKSGDRVFEFMNKFQIERVRAMSKSKDSPAWKNSYGEMCKKTVARRHSKVLPMSTDLKQFVEQDDDWNGPEDVPGTIGATVPRPQLSDFTDSETVMTPVAENDEPVAETVATEDGKHEAPETTDQPISSSAVKDEYKEWYTQGLMDYEDGKPLMADPEDATQIQKNARRDGWRAAEAKAKKG